MPSDYAAGSSIVSPAWLKAALATPSSAELRVVDVRWSMAASGRFAYDVDHVEGAVFLDLDADLSAAEGPGRHPIPDAAQVARVFSAIGVERDTHVVAYDDASGSIAARVWFLLRRYGHDRVSILDGGYRAWLAEGGPTTNAVPTFAATTLDLSSPREGARLAVVDKSVVRALSGRDDVVVIDVRAPERYRGESEPIDARAGHIPGAKNVPWTKNLFAEVGGVPRMRPAAELRELYASYGAGERDVVVYCGSGVTACLGLLALEHAGFGERARLYEGSWSDWARDPTLPAARGDQ